ncbi:MAG: galactokinase family protein [Pyrinomonadaceae bacterium]
MFKIVEGNSNGLTDVDRFVSLLNRLPGNLRHFFDDSGDMIVARAPGRLDVMGGIADYSGSLVLEMPIAEATFAAVQKTVDSKIDIVSLNRDGRRYSTFSMDVGDLGGDEPVDLASAKHFFASRDSGKWASYIAGAFFVLGSELGIRFENGAKIVVDSHVPIGKGVSSSAALEVAVMQAVCTAFEITVEPRKLALICQQVENYIVGAACGVMDQITSHCGETGKLTSLLCQPAELREAVDIPPEIEFWGIDSGVRHAVAGSDYSSVRVGAFMGYRMLADLAGLITTPVRDGLVRIEDNRWRGYLANVTPDEYEQNFRSQIPAGITGAKFLERYGGTSDTVTTVDPSRVYAVKAPAEHAIYESSRVQRFAKLLTEPLDDEGLSAAGELMFHSHDSYKACGLTEPRTDRIVELVGESYQKGLFGARTTGGGSGGTVVVMASRSGRSAITKLVARLTDEMGAKPYVFHGSSPGCHSFGNLLLRA